VRHSPDDAAFNRVLREEVEQTNHNERVIFIDTDNNVREAVYPSEFTTGVLQAVRQRLEDSGQLKAVIHISAHVLGGPGGRGPRTSVVEYLPTQEWYTTRFQIPLMTWTQEPPEVLEATKQLFREEE
jgi:hypothetical protein